MSLKADRRPAVQLLVHAAVHVSAALLRLLQNAVAIYQQVCLATALQRMQNTDARPVLPECSVKTV